MKKIVPVHRKKDFIPKNILEGKHVMREKGKPLSERRNGSFSKGSSLRERLQRLALYAYNERGTLDRGMVLMREDVRRLWKLVN